MSVIGNEPPRAALASRILVLLLAGIFVLGLAGFAVAALTRATEVAASPAPSEATGTSLSGDARFSRRLALAEPGDRRRPGVAPAAQASPASSPEASAEVDAGAVVAQGSDPETLIEQLMPVVPVARFWSTRVGLSLDDITRALRNGKLRGFKRVIVAEALVEPVSTSLGLEIHADVDSGDAAAVERAVKRGALGLLPATDVSADVRALDLGGASLFGNERVTDPADWPLVVNLGLPESAGWDQARTWVLVAGGDSFTDRGVFDSVVKKGRGVDYPFDGGTARVTGHGCCDPVFHDNVVPRYVLTGNKGAVRKLFRGAELAIANHEQPVTPKADFHGSGLRFSGRPELTEIFTRAGIDWLSLANNHIRDYGADGIKATRKILRRYGIGFGGAGKDLQQARQVRLLDAGGTKVAIIPCLGVVKVYWAEPGSAGATPCLDRYLVPDIRQATREADVVIVYPHWGVEYTRKPLPSMRKHAAKWVRAGADLVLGGHSHVAGAIEDFEGGPVLYSLGNLIFDQHWSTNTMESMLVEATFHGGDLAQLRLRPYIIHNQSQPNFLDPRRGEGRRLLQEVRHASKGWLDW